MELLDEVVVSFLLSLAFHIDLYCSGGIFLLVQAHLFAVLFSLFDMDAFCILLKRFESSFYFNNTKICFQKCLILG